MYALESGDVVHIEDGHMKRRRSRTERVLRSTECPKYRGSRLVRKRPCFCVRRDTSYAITAVSLLDSARRCVATPSER